MKRVKRPERRWEETREHPDLWQHVVGVLSALSYTVLIILAGIILCLLFSFAFQGQAVASEKGESSEPSAVAPGELSTSTELIERASEFDRDVVIYEGEAIGEALGRGPSRWVNLSDGKNAIGIRMKAADTQRISRFGDYWNNGDKVRVTGEFHRACPEHGGDLDIHAERVEILLQGTDRLHPVSGAKAALASFAVVLAASAGLLYRNRLREKRRNQGK